MKLTDSEEKRLSALRKLIRKSDISDDDLVAYWEEAYSETNARGAAILMATNVEIELRICIERRLHVPNYERLFGINSPLGTFENKIRMAEALEIIGPKTSKTLVLIKAIRNAFAHALTPISFETKEIEDVCSLLELPTSSPNALLDLSIKRKKPKTSREQFALVCHALVSDFSKYSTEAQQVFPPAGTLPNEKYQLLMRPKPLP